MRRDTTITRRRRHIMIITRKVVESPRMVPDIIHRKRHPKIRLQADVFSQLREERVMRRPGIACASLSDGTPQTWNARRSRGARIRQMLLSERCGANAWGCNRVSHGWRDPLS